MSRIDIIVITVLSFVLFVVTMIFLSPSFCRLPEPPKTIRSFDNDKLQRYYEKIKNKPSLNNIY